jgi:hypothetical protein
MMKERFEDLLYQSGLTAQGCWDQMDDYDRAAIEKFAELIVRECADLFDKDEIELSYTMRTIHNTIKEHFGVEE